ncbi:hypothetical protein B0H17DRAFT_1096718 [Mycena rosella]|uniref:Uncharacterized protein n=1 Tax=Mycena rosella TaxID=1033263 RepID=A0AAD7CQQ9_MYCRO|nr:hypothetical protein B0H17DRAFT_1096718 [Mycena rosella]
MGRRRDEKRAGRTRQRRQKAGTRRVVRASSQGSRDRCACWMRHESVVPLRHDRPSHRSTKCTLRSRRSASAVGAIPQRRSTHARTRGCIRTDPERRRADEQARPQGRQWSRADPTTGSTRGSDAQTRNSATR